MKLVGKISKMVVKATNPVSYTLTLDENQIPMNPLVGKKLSLRFTDRIHCISCGIAVKKSYQNGYCFPCTQKLAQCDLCIVKPERCHFHVGTCREQEWGQQYCMIPHVVYLSNASGLKVGITRQTQVLTRWIDQGAISAIELFTVPTRRVSGYVEVILAKTIADKTNWRKMLMGGDESVDLLAARENILQSIKQKLKPVYAEFGKDAVKVIEEPTLHQFGYPVLEYPKKVASLCFNKTPQISGTLMGIKGQYLIFDIGVINIRKYSGYVLEMSA